VAESDAPASGRSARHRAASRRVRATTDAHFYAGKFGEDILLRPKSSGIGGLVWVLPVVGLVAAAGFLGFAFWRWRRWDVS
jgi:cytochrome c-type biogenesis protein CcmH/NrfF